jgi:hypothetical protein
MSAHSSQSGWGGKRNGAGRKPDLSEEDQLFLAKLATSLAHLLTAGTGKRLYRRRREIIEMTSAEFEYRFARNASPNAIAKALRRYKNHAEILATERNVKSGLGMLHHIEGR